MKDKEQWGAEGGGKNREGNVGETREDRRRREKKEDEEEWGRE